MRLKNEYGDGSLPMKQKSNKIRLTCHKCGAKYMERVKESYHFEKEFDGSILIFEARAECRCGYVHGWLVDMKEAQSCDE